MTVMNARFVVVVVLNAVVAVSLSLLITVLVTRGPEPAPDAGAAPAPVADADAEPAPVAGGPEIERIKRDLMEHPGLIPFEGRLGGTMGFYDPSSIHVLSDTWVYARFEDGHVQGGMLLEYDVGENGEIAWEVLEARLE